MADLYSTAFSWGGGGSGGSGTSGSTFTGSGFSDLYTSAPDVSGSGFDIASSVPVPVQQLTSFSVGGSGGFGSPWWGAAGGLALAGAAAIDPIAIAAAFPTATSIALGVADALNGWFSPGPSMSSVWEALGSLGNALYNWATGDAPGPGFGATSSAAYPGGNGDFTVGISDSTFSGADPF